MRKALTYLLAIVAIMASCLLTAAGQNTDTAWWRLTANPNPAVVGNISANPVSFGPGLPTSGQSITYDPVLGLGAKFSLTGTLDTNKYFQFAVRPLPGYSFLINQIFSTNAIDFLGPASVLIRYSYDSVNFNSTFNQQQQIVFSLNGQSTRNIDTVFSAWYNLNIPVNSGKTIFFRMYAYSIPQNGVFYCKNFRVMGVANICSSPNVNNFSPVSAAGVCLLSDSSTVTVSSSTLSNGNYSVTYNLTGANNGAGFSAPMTFSSGTGTFKIPRQLLDTVGQTLVTITRINTNVSCFSTISANNSISFNVLSGLPAAPGAIAGQDTLCEFAASSVYQISQVPNANSYLWTVPSGWTITAGSGTASITLTAGSSAQSGNVSVRASNACGFGPAAVKPVYIKPATVITGQPQAITVCGDSLARFSVAATGVSLAYQWQVSMNGGSSYGNVISGQGSSATSYTDVAAASMNGYLYRAVVSGACGTAFSNAAILTVPAAIVNTISSSQSICDNVSPSVLSGIPSGGTGTYTYLWERSITNTLNGFSPAPSANDQQTYASPLLDRTISTTYYFRRTVMSSGCAKVSNVVQVSLAPSITPGSNVISANQVICLNAAPAALSGSVPTGGTAGNYLYKWERSETGPAINYDSIAASQSYAPRSILQSAWFRRIVTSGICKDTSTVISIQVVSPNASLLPDTVQICTGQTAMLTARSSSIIDAQDFGDNARGWSQSNALNSGGLASPNPLNNGSGNSNDWVRYSNASFFNGYTYSSPDSSDFLMTQSNRLNETTSTYLLSPSYNTSGFGFLFLRFFVNFHFISAPDAGYVDVSTDNITWTTVKTYSGTLGTSNAFLNEKVDLSAYVNRPSLYIRLRYFGQYGSWWAIDNLMLEGVSSTLSSNVWSPPTYLFTDAAATVPYQSNASASIVYSKPLVQTTYSVGTAGCFSMNTSTVKVSPTIGTASVSGSGTFCSSATLSASASVTGTLYFQGTSASGTSTADPSSTKVVNASGTYYFRALSPTGCWTTADSAVVVVNQPPVITGQPAAQNICMGQNDTFRIQATGTNIMYQWQSSSDGGNTWNGISDNANFSGTSTATLRVLNTQVSLLPLRFRAMLSPAVACGSQVTSNTVSLKFRNVWTGSVNGDWTNPANWSESTLPSSACSDLYITGSAAFQPVLTGTASVQNIHVVNGGLLTINGGELKVSGNIVSQGAIDAHAGTVEFNGAGSVQTFAGSVFAGKRLHNLTINNPNGLALANIAGDTLKLSGKLRFGNVNTTFNTNNNLYLLADSTGAASVADLTNGGVNSNTIIGEATVETFIGRGRKWRFLAIPAASGQTFRQSWQEDNAVTQNNRPGYGIMITDNNNATYLNNGFDYFTGGGPSVKKYNTSTTLYDGIPSTSSVINTSGGYMVYIRGDRSATPNNQVTGPAILRTKGALRQGAQPNLNVPANTVVDVGNPFASPINMMTIQKPGVQDAFYIWDPRLGGSFGLGGFQLFTQIGGAYYPVPGGGSYSDTASFNMIQSGQAFFVRGAAGGRIKIKETDKGSDFRQVFRTSGGQSQLARITLYEMGSGLPVIGDGVLADFDYTYNNDVDSDDFIKLSNAGMSVSLLRNGQALSIERRKPVQTRDTIFINVSGISTGNYRWGLNISNLDTSGRTAFLVDSHMNLTSVLNLNGTNSIDFSTDANAASRAANRFMIVFEQTAPLPVRMVQAGGVRIEKKAVNVSWTSENEISLDHYELERSLDGRQFSSTGLLQMPANNGGRTRYLLIDRDAPDGVVFYRVRAVGSEGCYYFSDIIKVMPWRNSIPAISVYPNPVKNKKLNFRYRQQQPGTYHLALYNNTGQVLYKSGLQMGGEEGVVSIDLPSEIPAGAYRLLLRKPDGAGQVLDVILE